jgi:hypothetical protein
MEEKLQEILTRLYTDAAFRKDFFADRRRCCEENNLAYPGLVVLLDELNQDQVEYFAQGLLLKRMSAVKKIIPHTTCRLGNNFDRLFLEHGRKFVPGGIHLHHEDAVGFLDHLRSEPELQDEKLEDIIRYERALAWNFLHPKKWRFASFAFDIHKLFQSRTAHEPLVRRRTFILWKEMRVFLKLSLPW